MLELVKVTAQVHLIEKDEEGVVINTMTTNVVDIYKGYKGVIEWAKNLENEIKNLEKED